MGITVEIHNIEEMCNLMCDNKLPENDFRRTCTECGCKMESGYVIRDGEEYFCSDDCLWAWYSEEEYEELCENDEAYWTMWEEGD